MTRQQHDHNQNTWKQASGGAYKPVPFEGDDDPQTEVIGVEATASANSLQTIEAEFVGEVKGEMPPNTFTDPEVTATPEPRPVGRPRKG